MPGDDPISARTEEALHAAEERVFAAIRARDVEALEAELADDFLHSSPGSPDQDRNAFLRAIREMPYRIEQIGGEDLRVRVFGETALLSGVQRARVTLGDGTTVDAATAFVDVFSQEDGRWRLRHAVSVELPEAPTAEERDGGPVDDHG